MFSSIGSHRPLRLSAAILASVFAFGAGLQGTGLVSAHAQTPQNSTATPAEGKAAPPSDATKKAARQNYSDGQRAYEGGDYAAAITYFSKAQELIPSPHAQYWIAMTQDKLGKVAEAHAGFAAFFANPGHTALGEEKLSKARARFAELAAIPGDVKVTTEPPEASLSVDGMAQAGASPYALKLTPGKHRLQITAKGYQDQSSEVDVQPGQALEQAFTLTATPAVAPTPAALPAPAPEPASQAVTPATERNMVPAYVTLGVAGAAAIAGTIFGIQALSAKSDFDKNPTEENADSVERNGLIADMAFGVAVTLGVTGVVLLTSKDDPAEAAQRRAPRHTTRLVVAPYASHKGGGATAQLKF